MSRASRSARGKDRLLLDRSSDLPPPPAALLDGASLFLDFDGTLAGFEDDPEAVFLTEAEQARLSALYERLDGRLCIISGRALSSLEQRIGDDRIALVGSHGLERRIDGRTESPDDGQPGLAAASAKIAAIAADEGVRFEDKTFGAALHFRECPDKQAELHEVIVRLAARYGLEVQDGNHVIEVRLPGGTKGDALDRLMRDAPLCDGRPVMIGDDLTDEHAFRAARAMGGAAVLVGPARETAAAYQLESVAALWEWLR
ncbi:trehalose-phosphatase [Sphingomicrobium sp. XHP0239]|uniref:trehalose-phosphatase n=1 Tax=Sphingomicrobium maritimum TaxID=3133972 RepID=UPI0031CC4A7E